MTSRHRDSSSPDAAKRADKPFGAGRPDSDQPDPVTLSEPTFDDSGRLRWSSAG